MTCSLQCSSFSFFIALERFFDKPGFDPVCNLAWKTTSWSMDLDDEFNQFVMDEIIDSSSSDDERKAVISGVVHLIVEDTLNHPGRIGFVEGHDVVDRERQLHHALLYKDYFSEKPTFGPKTFRRRLVFVPTISIVIVTFNRLLYKWS